MLKMIEHSFELAGFIHADELRSLLPYENLGITVLVTLTLRVVGLQLVPVCLSMNK